MHGTHHATKPYRLLAFKLMLDLVMCLMLGLLYRANIVTLRAHMLAGIALAVLIGIHLFASRACIARAAKSIRDKTASGHIKASFILMTLLLACFCAILVSGVFFAIPTIKGTEIPALAKGVHYWASAASIVLVGIHIGWYLPLIFRVIRKHVDAPRLVRIALSTLVVLFGLWSLFTTDFLTWLFAPLSHVSIPATDSLAVSIYTGAQFVALICLFAAGTHALKTTMHRRFAA